MLKIKNARQAKIILCMLFILFGCSLFTSILNNGYITNMKSEIVKKLERETDYEVTILKEIRGQPISVSPNNIPLEEVGKHLGDKFIFSQKRSSGNIVYEVEDDSIFFKYIEVYIGYRGVMSDGSYPILVNITSVLANWVLLINLLTLILFVYCIVNYKNIGNVLKKET